MTSEWFSFSWKEECMRAGALAVAVERLNGYTDWDLSRGDVVEKWGSRASFRSKKPRTDGKPDDWLCTDTCLPVFSPGLQQALTEANIGVGEIQYLPVDVVLSTGEKIDGFAIANVIRRVEALCREKSFMLDEDPENLDPLTGKPDVTSIGRPVLQRALLGEADIFRLMEFTPELIVSSRFAALFIERGFTGASCRPVEVSD